MNSITSRKTSRCLLGATAVLTLGFAHLGNAAILASFEFDGTIASLDSTVAPADLTVSAFGNAGNTTDAAFGFAPRFGSDPNYAYWVPDSVGEPGGTGDGVHTSAENLSDNEYMGFTITADPGFAITLDDIDFRASRNGGGGTINRLDLIPA